MKRRLSLTLLLVLTILVGAQGQDLFRVAGRVTADGLRVRERPDLDAGLVGSLNADAHVEILDFTAEKMTIGEMSARWYHVRTLGAGKVVEGWCYGHFVEAKAGNLVARAISLDQDRLVRDLLDQGVDINERAVQDGVDFGDEYIYSTTVLIEAIRRGRTALVQSLLDRGADPNIPSSYGEPGGGKSTTALIKAVEIGAVDMIPPLVSAGADLEKETRTMGAGGEGNKMTPLSVATGLQDSAVVSSLIAAGADVNHAVEFFSLVHGDSRQTPLDIAENLGDDRMVQLLLSHGAKKASQ